MTWSLVVYVQLRAHWEGKLASQTLAVLRGKRERQKKKINQLRRSEVGTTGHLEEVRRMGIFPEPLAREPVEWKSQPRQQSGRQEHEKGQPLDGFFFLEPSVEEKGHA